MFVIKELRRAFENEFDLVGIIKTEEYLKEAKKLNINVPNEDYPTAFVLGLAYPKRIISASRNTCTASIYTYGEDYHHVLNRKIRKIMSDYSVKYWAGVDSHHHNERLAAVLAGLGFFGKNQLVINNRYGSFIFLGLVFVNLECDLEVKLEVNDQCGDCRICLDACPTKALQADGYDILKCISNYNQAKNVLDEEQIKHNYCLLGCDICQLVCPKNKNLKISNHDDFALTGKELVYYEDLFLLSEKTFRLKYQDMAYLWKGKTILMRNALTLLLRSKNVNYNHLVKASLTPDKPLYYLSLAQKIYEDLLVIEKEPSS